MSKFIKTDRTTKPLYFRSSLSLSACHITGIHITLNIPSLPLVFEYENPLARIENAIDLAKLGFPTHKTLDKDILAGTLLSILSHYHLISDNLSATQRNILLQESCSHYTLSESLRIFSSLSRRRAEILPKLSLESLAIDVINSKREDILKNYNKACNDILFPSPSESTRIYSPFSKGKIVELKSLSSDTKKEFRSLANILLEESEISKKFHMVLIEVCKNNNLVSIDDDLRNRIIDKLTILDTANANKLAKILLTVKKEMTVEERIFQQQLSDGFEDAISASLPSLGSKPTIKDILAAKKAGLSIPEYLASVASAYPKEESQQQDIEASEGKDDSNEFPLTSFEDTSNEF